MIDWSIAWLIDGMTDWLMLWLIDWLMDEMRWFDANSISYEIINDVIKPSTWSNEMIRRSNDEWMNEQKRTEKSIQPVCIRDDVTWSPPSQNEMSRDHVPVTTKYHVIRTLSLIKPITVDSFTENRSMSWWLSITFSSISSCTSSWSCRSRHKLLLVDLINRSHQSHHHSTFVIHHSYHSSFISFFIHQSLVIHLNSSSISILHSSHSSFILFLPWLWFRYNSFLTQQ